MPDIQKLYEEYSAQGEDAEAVILGIAGPGIGQEGNPGEEITEFYGGERIYLSWYLWTESGRNVQPVWDFSLSDHIYDRQEWKCIRLCSRADDGRYYAEHYRTDSERAVKDRKKGTGKQNRKRKKSLKPL